jgi:hypothetical protein
LKSKIMADIPPISSGMPTGAVPPKKETGKVQPKKETVRINLPPKPSAAPTIKLPTLPPGGPTGAPSAMPAPAQAAPRAAAAPVAQSRPAPAIKRAAPVAAPAISDLDKIFAIAAAVAGLLAIGTTVWMMLILNSAVSQ